jgi:hypothetical protein
LIISILEERVENRGCGRRYGDCDMQEGLFFVQKLETPPLANRTPHGHNAATREKNAECDGSRAAAKNKN